ncbi:MAG TPA: RND family transporter [Gammaproteobacteria bacterium]|nr:RND family transporter [Gammaproteobacteria bacterium]
MEAFFALIVRRPWLALCLLLVATAGFVSQLPRLTMETNIEEMLPKGMEAYVNKKRLERVFSSADMVVIGIENDGPDGIYTPHTLRLVDELTQWLRSRREFRTIALSDLMSLSTIKDIRGTADGMQVERFMERPAETPEAIIHLKQRLVDNGIYLGSIVSEDGKGTLLVVRPDPSYVGRYFEIYRLLEAKLDEIRARGGPERILVTGRPIIEGVFGIYMPEDMQHMQPVILSLLALLLFLSFRNIRGVLIPLAVVVLSELWMLGTMAAAGIPMYTVTTMLPILILAIGIADSVHLLTHIRVEAGRQAALDKREVIIRGMSGMWAPILMTTLTTAAGFLSMLGSELLPMRYFGVFAAVGIVYAFIITVLFIPAIEAVLPQRERPLDKLAFHGYLEAMTRVVTHHPRRILAIFGLALLLSAYGLSQIRVNSSLVSEFRPSDPIRKADVMLNAHFAGTNALDVMIDTGRQDGVLEPGFLKGLSALQTAVEAEPMVGDSASIAEFLAEMNKVMHGGDPVYRQPPARADLAAQYLLLYSFSGAPDDFDAFVTSDYRQAHVRIQMKTDSSADAARLIEIVERNAERWFPGARVDFAGTAYTTHQFSDLIIAGQIQSLTVALTLIFLLCFAMFRRLADAAMAMLPVSLAIVAIYGIMGIAGIPLEIGTAITGGMALGIGVDFAIHYLYRYRDYESRGLEYAQIVAKTNEDTGRALVFNALVVIGGFLVLLKAHLYPQVKLGVLVAGSMAICYLASCYLFPVLLRGRER